MDMNFDIYLGSYLFKRAQNVSFVVLYRRTLKFYRQITKLGLVSNGNCTILPVDLCCMQFRHRLNILKKANMYAYNVGAQPDHRNF